jgi:hypothetical protein
MTYLQTKVWSKCAFCGASNGLYKQPLEQHRPRCRFVGPANTDTIMVPNYFMMIAEDDKRLLPLLKLKDELKEARKQVSELEKKVPRESKTSDTDSA